MKKRKVLSAESQRNLIKGFAGSGLSKSEYCRRADISVSAFYRYQRVHGGKFEEVYKPEKKNFYVKLFGIKLIKLELSV